MRMSQYKEPNQDQQKKEESYTVDQISKHSYFKKGASGTSRGAFGATPDSTARGNGMPDTASTNRYNPIKHLNESSKKQLNLQIQADNEDAEDGSTGGHTLASNFFQKEQKKEYIPNVPTMIPEKMTSAENVYSNLSSKIDPIKQQVQDNRMSYLDTIKEESEQRRTRFYKSNLAQIYAQSGTYTNVQNSGIFDPQLLQDDRGSVKSE